MKHYTLVRIMAFCKMYVPTCDILQDSWKRKLRQKFKNIRRPSRAERAGIEVPEKKRKLEVPPQNTEQPTASDLAEYEEHCQHLNKVYESHKWTVAGMTTLMEVTAKQRSMWIKEESPTVTSILQKFPCLQEPTLVSMHLDT